MRVLSGRLRGGFQASLLPGHGQDETSIASESSSTFLSEGSGENELSDQSDVTMGDLSVSVQSILRMCRAFSEQTKRLEQRLGNLEQLQTKSVKAMKELSELMKKQECASFSIKHSSFEVWKYTNIIN